MPKQFELSCYSETQATPAKFTVTFRVGVRARPNVACLTTQNSWTATSPCNKRHKLCYSPAQQLFPAHRCLDTAWTANTPEINVYCQTTETCCHQQRDYYCHQQSLVTVQTTTYIPVHTNSLHGTNVNILSRIIMSWESLWFTHNTQHYTKSFWVLHTSNRLYRVPQIKIPHRRNAISRHLCEIFIPKFLYMGQILLKFLYFKKISEL